MASNTQQDRLGMESNALIARAVAAMTCAGCKMVAAGRVVGPDWIETLAGFGRGCGIGEAATFASTAIVGGDRRGRMAGVRAGRGIRAISRFAPSFRRPGVASGMWGSALRTVSFFGSAMTERVAPRRIAENSFVVTR